MVAAVYEAKQDRGWLAEAFLALEKEYAYWTTPPRSVSVINDPYDDGGLYWLSRYYADTTLPRPESYRSFLLTTLRWCHGNLHASKN